MAKVTEITEKVERKVLVDEVTGINLQLSLEEAAFLKTLFGRVCGPSNGKRIISEKIWNPLSINQNIPDMDISMKMSGRNLWFD